MLKIEEEKIFRDSLHFQQWKIYWLKSDLDKFYQWKSRETHKKQSMGSLSITLFNLHLDVRDSNQFCSCSSKLEENWIILRHFFDFSSTHDAFSKLILVSWYTILKIIHKWTGKVFISVHMINDVWTTWIPINNIRNPMYFSESNSVYIIQMQCKSKNIKSTKNYLNFTR